jgi:hypothetical protein
MSTDHTGATGVASGASRRPVAAMADISELPARRQAERELLGPKRAQLTVIRISILHVPPRGRKHEKKIAATVIAATIMTVAGCGSSGPSTVTVTGTMRDAIAAFRRRGKASPD